MLMSQSDAIVLLGSFAAAGALILMTWFNVIAPARRRQKLKNPVRAHFTIRNSEQILSGRDVLHDPYHIRRFVLPASSRPEAGRRRRADGMGRGHRLRSARGDQATGEGGEEEVSASIV